MNAIERLEKFLDESDEHAEKLERKIARLTNELRGSREGWTTHRDMAAEQTLPVPRLQLAYEPDAEAGWRDYTVRYSMVMRHLTGNVVEIPLSSTRIQGSHREEAPVRQISGMIELPFRDGAHIMHDAVTLTMPAFAVLGERVWDLSHERYTDDYRHQIAAGQKHRDEDKAVPK